MRKPLGFPEQGVTTGESTLAALFQKAWKGGRTKAGRPVGELLRKPG